MTARGKGVAAFDQTQAEAIALLRRARGPFVLWVVTEWEGDNIEVEGVYAIHPKVARVALDDIGGELEAFIAMGDSGEPAE